MVNIEATGLRKNLAHIGACPAPGRDDATARCFERHWHFALLDEHLGARVLAVAILVAPVAPPVVPFVALEHSIKHETVEGAWLGLGRLDRNIGGLDLNDWPIGGPNWLLAAGWAHIRPPQGPKR